MVYLSSFSFRRGAATSRWANLGLRRANLGLSLGYTGRKARKRDWSPPAGSVPAPVGTKTARPAASKSQRSCLTGVISVRLLRSCYARGTTSKHGDWHMPWACLHLCVTGTGTRAHVAGAWFVTFTALC